MFGSKYRATLKYITYNNFIVSREYEESDFNVDWWFLNLSVEIKRDINMVNEVFANGFMICFMLLFSMCVLFIMFCY